ncbi:error-prone DNA polymerase [Methylobacterium sp. WL116]|uniref:error-prone DNA polymerase n=1 Tax=Methylobacterium sp. WL116 TaxID=2603889 RepID=UPI0011CB37A9|nr:error-prone DNA polymerase [Methylobacterium sp. WL116]TXM95222.1 DNA polymerase III subunit alpha [Methylobacterium sp. WL116]
MAYVELQATTHYSFLRGASSPRDLFATAALLGHQALGIADRNSLAGIVQAHDAAKATGLRLVVGCRLDLTEPGGPSLLVYPIDRAAYGRLCRLLTLGKGRAEKGGCRLHWDDVGAWADGLVAVLLTDRPDAALADDLARLKALFGDRAYCALTRRYRPDDALRLEAVAAMARDARVSTMATGDVLYHVPDRRVLQDVVTAIRLRTTVDRLGHARERHAGRHLVAPPEAERLMQRHPDAVARTGEILHRCRFSLDELTYSYPTEAAEDGTPAQDRLEALTWAGAADRYPDGLPDRVAAQIRHELTLIERLAYAAYFLTVESIVRFARTRGILCQGRGSAANSAVCFVLGITSIDPVRQGLLFERFISENRGDPPDIDVDFEHERREEVIQWVYETYGRHRAALCATVIRYGTRGAVREVGKALGVPEDVTGALAGLVWGMSRDGVGDREVASLNLNPDDRRLRMTLDPARQLIDTPRHLGLHPGGFVLTLHRLDELCPVMPATMADRQTIEWDKIDIETLKFMKVDVLGLGMLGCLRRAFDLLAVHRPGAPTELATIPAEDPATYAMIRRADTVGTFQIESRAQMAMLPRMKPTTFYDLVIQVAIVRPGPIQGDMVHPYLRRREGRERVTYPTEALRRVLEKTLGVPLFQEQAMQVAIVAAGFTPDEADRLRRAMATFKSTAGVSQFRDKLVQGMVGNGYDPEFAERTFRQLEGFGFYGFPESHAASFALIAYASSWLKCRHPDVFCCALLNAQPMGFYAPAQLVRDAQAHGVEIRPVDVDASVRDCTLEPAGGRWLAVREGFRMVRGLPERDVALLVAVRPASGYASVEDLWRRAGISARGLRALAGADAFLSLGLDRRAALWAIRGLADRPLDLFAAADAREGQPRPERVEPGVDLVPMSAGREVVEDYHATGLSLRAHPLAFVRSDLAAQGYRQCRVLDDAPSGRALVLAGLVLMRQKPGSANGTMFVTLADETGIANLIVWPPVFERHRRLILTAGMMGVRGRVQRQGLVVHVLVDSLVDLTALLRRVGDRTGREAAFPLPHGRGDEARSGGRDQREPSASGGATGAVTPPAAPAIAQEIRVATRNFR